MTGLDPRIAALAAALAVAGCSESAASSQNATPTPTADRVAAAPDDSWITLSGQVRSLAPTSFQLDYGQGEVLVEMDDWDRFQETLALQPGDRVTVAGLVDRDFLEAKKIEAGSVYVQNLGTHFWANSQDEEDLAIARVHVPNTLTVPAATGLVTAIEGREFVLGSGDSAMRVDTSAMTTDPMDAIGQPRIRIGDRVQVWGPLDVDPNERPEIAAEGVAVIRATPMTASAKS